MIQSSTSTKKLEQLLYCKQYEGVQGQLKLFSNSSLAPQKSLLIQMSKLRTNLWQQSTQIDKTRQRQKIDFMKTKSEINRICDNYANQVNRFLVLIHRYAMEAFLFQLETNFVDENSKDEEQRKLIKQISKLPALVQVFGDRSIQTKIQQSLYLTVSLLQLYVKKNTKTKAPSQRQQLNILSQIIQRLSQKYPQTLVLCKRLFMIVIHLKLHNSNCYSFELSEQICEYLDISIKCLEGKEVSLINSDTVVVLLYTCLKIMVGLNQLSNTLVDKLTGLYKIFRMANVRKTYSSHIIHLFFIIKIAIFKQKQPQSENSKAQQKLSQFSQKFSVFLNMNLDEIIVALNQITRNIIRHKVASLSTIIGIKLDIYRFSKDFLEIMHDSPYNNDVQTIKLCFQLFQARQYEKIQNLLQSVLSVPATKQLKMREVLIAMSSIITGLRLNHREQALLYNKLNHQNYLSEKQQKKQSSKSQILKQQTFLQHIGFGYYNLACHEVYLQNKQIYLVKALENFVRSYQINKENYLLNYCLSKTYLLLYDTQKAYLHAMEACKSHRGAWAPFCLLACIYICDRKFHKAFLLIEELIKKYPEEPVLHYARAYLQVNKILLDVEHDQEIQAAKMLGEEYYLIHFERLLKHKSVSTLTQYCQNYYQLSLKMPISDPQQNFFSNPNLQSDPPESAKYLLQILPLLLQVNQISTVQSMLKFLPQSNIETLYQKAVLHLRRKETKEARELFETILKINHAHTPTLIKLSQMPKVNDVEGFKECLEFLDVAGKYVNNPEFMLAKGVVLSWLNRVDESNELLVSTRDLGWVSMLPDLMYYY